MLAYGAPRDGSEAEPHPGWWYTLCRCAIPHIAKLPPFLYPLG